MFFDWLLVKVFLDSQRSCAVFLCSGSREGAQAAHLLLKAWKAQRIGKVFSSFCFHSWFQCGVQTWVFKTWFTKRDSPVVINPFTIITWLWQISWPAFYMYLFSHISLQLVSMFNKTYQKKPWHALIKVKLLSVNHLTGKSCFENLRNWL